MLFRPSNFRLPGMASELFFFLFPDPPVPSSFSFLISQIELTPHSTHQQIWLLQLTNYQKNMSGMCHRHRATQRRRPQRAQISLETPCPLFFFSSHRGRLASLRLQKQGCWSFSILLFSVALFLTSTKNVNATFCFSFVVPLILPDYLSLTVKYHALV